MHMYATRIPRAGNGCNPYPYKDERLSLAPHIARIGSGGARTAARWAAEAGEALEHARGTAKEADDTWAASTGHSS